MPVSKKKFEIGQRVEFAYDGADVQGDVTAVNDKKKVCDVQTEDGETLECEFDELTVVEKKAVKKGKKVEEEPEEEPEEEEEEKPKKGKKKSSETRSLTAAFNAKPPAPPTAFGLPPGNHECLVIGGEAAETEKGTSAYLEYVGVNDEEIDGRTQRQYFQLFSPDNEELPGIEYFKRAIVDLGFEDELEFDEDESIVDALNKLFKKIKKAMPWVSVTVKEAKGFSNLYLQGLMEDQDEKPELPDTD